MKPNPRRFNPPHRLTQTLTRSPETHLTLRQRRQRGVRRRAQAPALQAQVHHGRQSRRRQRWGVRQEHRLLHQHQRVHRQGVQAFQQGRPGLGRERAAQDRLRALRPRHASARRRRRCDEVTRPHRR
ncbi:predicted protein [Micromonas commoda]|uniref:Uncharacterized protein n=1 Tax=Micromonas commoda (strain RCC299 / NOUM17 / CCMP2709) TaxID=296587 RepID=C1FJ41_MICCC|nr:predicted protein [Micromonas commoda]ACO70289.1 predicted protein [Micromonas commoda]|eukprot:XP_002509031.1 predicted protein [Micromonas commoda]